MFDKLIRLLTYILIAILIIIIINILSYLDDYEDNSYNADIRLTSNGYVIINDDTTKYQLKKITIYKFVKGEW